MRPVRLRTEYLQEPLGIDVVRPRFSWNCEGGQVQDAYRVVAVADGVTVWDSGRVASSRMTHIEYEGRPLRSRERVEWTVAIWGDGNSEVGGSGSSWFEMGLLEAEDWTAQWVAGDYRPRRNRRYPVDYFRREFLLPSSATTSRLYITACGLYEASLNGHRVGDFRLAPGSTDYRHRLQYQVYDVAEQLVLGGLNVLEIRLADGWYRGGIGAFGETNVFGRRTKLRAQLEVRHGGDRIDRIETGREWTWSNDGPLRFADLKDGEIYDARRTPSFAGRARVVAERLRPRASNNVAVREQEVFTPTLIVTPSGRRVLDFGQNIAGFVAFDVRAAAGQVISMRLGEILDGAGEFTQDNFQLPRPVGEIGRVARRRLMGRQFDKIRGPVTRTPLQEVFFSCAEGQNSYKTEFAVFGFRYALIETDVDVTPSDFRAIAVYSDMEQTGSFTCSDPAVEKLVDNTRWSMKGNFLDVPTDCPTRERLGWTGDMQIFFETAASLMDIAAFTRKWLDDVRDGTSRDGKPSAVAPYNGFGLMYELAGGSVGWGDAAVLVPYRYWKRYGDDRLLHDYYGLMRGYAMFMISHAGRSTARRGDVDPLDRFVYEKGVQLGEWLEPEEFRDGFPDIKGPPQHTEVATAYFHYTLSIMTEVAEELGHTDDREIFAEHALGARRAYNAMFVRAGTIDTDRQAKLVRPLALGLLDGEVKRQVQERLVAAVTNYDFRVGTGFLSTPFLLGVLTDAGREDVAYRILQNDRSPSWLAEVRAGATTVWEDWEGNDSQNHYSPGAVCQWLFDTVAGIRVASANRFVITPIPGGRLTHARAEHLSLYGSISSGWVADRSRVTFTVVVPPNTTAELRLPDGSIHELLPGTHTRQTRRLDTGLSWRTREIAS